MKVEYVRYLSLYCIISGGLPSTLFMDAFIEIRVLIGYLCGFFKYFFHEKGGVGKNNRIFVDAGYVKY